MATMFQFVGSSLEKGEDEETARAVREEANKQTTLLKLPAELRNRIFQLAMPNDATFGILTFWKNIHRKNLALLQTCRTLRKQTVPVFFGTNTFTFDLRTPQDFALAESFLQNMPTEGIASLRKLVVETEMICGCCKGAIEEHGNITFEIILDQDCIPPYRIPVRSLAGRRRPETGSLIRKELIPDVDAILLRISEGAAKQNVRVKDLRQLFRAARPVDSLPGFKTLGAALGKMGQVATRHAA